MTLPQGWTTISVGLKIVYNDHMTDLRTNADYLDDNVANRAHNTTYLLSHDITADNDQYSTADNPHNSAADNDQYSTADNPHYSSNNPGYYPGYDSGVLASTLYGQYYVVHTSVQTSACTTINNTVMENVACTTYNSSVRSTYYPTNFSSKN